MNVEYLYILLNYLAALSKRDRKLELCVPLLFAISFAVIQLLFSASKEVSIAIHESLTFLRVLLGFTMASFALFLTKSPNLEKAIQYPTGIILNKKQLNLYEYIVLSFTYLIIIEVLVQLFYFAYSFVPFNVNGNLRIVLHSMYIFVFFHLMLATIKVITEINQILQCNQI